jgi:hypothetical protein
MGELSRLAKDYTKLIGKNINRNNSLKRRKVLREKKKLKLEIQVRKIQNDTSR